MYLDGNRDAGEERVVPVELGQQLTHHLTDRYWLSTTSFRVDFLFPPKSFNREMGKKSNY